MGKTTYSIIGFGMTVDEAERDALARDREQNGTQDGYSGGFNSSTREDDHVVCLVKPVPAKAGKVVREPRVSPLKWETRYVARLHHFDGDTTVVSEKTMGKCIAAAKAWATRNIGTLYLEVEKIAVQGNVRFGCVHSAGGTRGQWRFFGEARE